MKQNKSVWVLGLMLSLYSCSEIDELPLISSTSSSDTVTTRTDGDAVYDVLGYGYDVTEEYMGENSTRAKILDVAAFDKDNPDRFDTPFLGTIDQRVYAGEDYYSFLKDLSSNSNFSGSIGSVGKADKDSGFFSGTLSTGFESKTKYSYSSKYSFARAEVFKKQRRYYVNTDLETLKKYLSSAFIEDLNRHSADRIVEIYGTHVLTNVIVGGKYIAYYKSAIIDTSNRSEKKKTVSAGAKFNLSKIGLDANGSWSKTEITEQNNRNSNWECHIKSIGGSTSGTSITLSPSQGPTFTINLGDWTKSVDDQHSRLVDVNWNATYPIYDLISDPIKKAELKDAVIRYINSKKVEILKLIPLYEMYESWGKDRYYITSWDAVQNEINQYGNEYRRHVGYILSEPIEDAVPFYEMYEPWGKDRYYITSWDAVQNEINQYGNEYRRHVGYILSEPIEDAVPFYEMYEPWGKDRYYITSWDAVQYEIKQYKNEYRYQVGYILN